MGSHRTPFRLILDRIPVYDTDGLSLRWSDVRRYRRTRLYQLQFSDRAVYVGMSKSIVQRIGNHKCRPSNSGVYSRIMERKLASVVISHAYFDDEQAYLDELKLINFFRSRGENVLNKVRGPSPPGIKQPRKIGVGGAGFGEARCSICKQSFPRSHFNVDRSRSCGISSKCKTCKNVGSGICYEARKRGLVNANGSILSGIWQRFKDDPSLNRKTFPWHEFEKP